MVCSVMVNAASPRRLGIATGLATSALIAIGFAGLLAAVIRSARAAGWDDTASAWVHAHATEAGLRWSEALSLLGSPVPWGIAAVAITALVVRRELAPAATWVAALGGGKVVETLGVHFPTDVAGGLLAGGAWLLLSITIAEAWRASVRPVARTPADDSTAT